MYLHRRPIKVAMITNSPGYGGVPRVVHALASRLDKSRYTPFIYYLKGFEENNHSARAGSDAVDDSDICCYGSIQSTGKLDTITQLAIWLQKNNIDIVHTHSYRPNLYGRVAARLCALAHLRIISHYHNQYDDKWLCTPSSLLLEKQLAATTNAMLAVSDNVRDHVASRVGVEAGDITVVNNGLDEDRFQGYDRSRGRGLLKLDADATVVALIGRVCEQKGTDLYVDAALSIVSAERNIHFLIVGHIEDAALYQSLYARIESAGATSTVRFTNHIDDMAALYASVDLVVAPSRWEGFGLALIEAMAAGIPVIASTAGAIPEVTGNGQCAELISLTTSAELATAIERLLSDPRRCRELRESGRARSKEFTWDRSVALLSDVYEQVLESA